MVVNQLANFLDIYALGMGAALLYVWLVQCYLAAEKRKAMAWQGIATLLCVLSTWECCAFSGCRQGERPGGFAGRADDAPPAAGAGRCGNPAHSAVCGAPAALFDGQPGDGLAGGGFDELLPAAPEPGRSPETAGRSTVRQRGTEPGRGQPWQLQYTLLCFGLSLLGAAFITLLIEKPCAKVLKKMFARGKAENKA